MFNAFAACLTLLCFFAHPIHAYVAGVRPSGMGGTGIAYSQDAYACVYNPAGGVDVEDRMDTLISWTRNRGRTNVHGNLDPTVNGSFNPFVTRDVYDFSGALNKRYCLCGRELAINLADYNRDYYKTHYNAAFPILGTSHVGLEYIHETFIGAISTKFNGCQSIGLSLDLHVQRFMVKGIQNFDNPEGSLFPGHVTNRGYDYSVGLGVTLGWKWHITDNFTVGLTYRPKTSMTKFHKYKGFLAQHGKVDIPEKVGAGIAYHFLPCANFALDFEWLNWKPIKSSSNTLLHDGKLALLGSANGSGFGFRDQYFISAGVDCQITESLILRAGYSYNNTPFKRSQTADNALLMVIIDHIITCGATYMLGSSQEVSICYAHGFENIVKGHHSIPEFLGGGEIDLKADVNFLALGWAYVF